MKRPAADHSRGDSEDAEYEQDDFEPDHEAAPSAVGKALQREEKTQEVVSPQAGVRRGSVARRGSQAELQSSPSLSALLASASLTDVKGLTATQWRQRLQRLTQQIAAEGHSRGQRLSLPDELRLDEAEEKQAEGDRRSLSRPSSRPSSRSALRRNGVPALSSDAYAAASAQRSYNSTAPQLSATARSAVSTSSAMSSASSLTLRHAAFAKDAEGMDQERRQLQQERQRLRSQLELHQRQLAEVTAQFELWQARMLQRGREKGLVRVGGRWEAMAEVGAERRLNPHLSSVQLVRSLQREVAELEREKEERECEMDAIEEQEREQELSRARERRQTGEEAEDEEGQREDDELSALSQRQRLAALKARKRAVLEEIHSMQDELSGSRDRQRNSRPSLRLSRLMEQRQRLQSHCHDYGLQISRAKAALDRYTALHCSLHLSRTAAAR